MVNRTQEPQKNYTRRNIVTGIPGPKSSGLEAGTPLKSFQLFCDDAMKHMITEIVTCSNQKIDNVRKVYKSRRGFSYDINETKVRALVGILLFLGVKKSANENATSIWAKM